MTLLILHPSARRLHDFAVREAGAPLSQRVPQHLARCARCRRDVSAIRDVVSEGNRLRPRPERSRHTLDRILYAHATGVRVTLPVTDIPAVVPTSSWLAARERMEGVFDRVLLFDDHGPRIESRVVVTGFEFRGSWNRLSNARVARAAAVIACVALPVLGIAQVVAYVHHRATSVIEPAVHNDGPVSVLLAGPPMRAVRAPAHTSRGSLASAAIATPDTARLSVGAPPDPATGQRVEEMTIGGRIADTVQGQGDTSLAMARSRLEALVQQGRTNGGTKLTEQELNARLTAAYAMPRVFPMQQVLMRADTLRLTDGQADWLAELQRSFVRATTSWIGVATYLAALPDHFDADSAWERIHFGVTEEVSRKASDIAAANAALTDAQWTALPSAVQRSLDPTCFRAAFPAWYNTGKAPPPLPDAPAPAHPVRHVCP